MLVINDSLIFLFPRTRKKLYNLKNEARSVEVIPRFFAFSANSLNESRSK
jgi:hypothetical protein